MEQDPSKPKIVVEEIQDEIKSLEKDSKEIQKDLDEALEGLKLFIENLEADIGYLDHMQSGNEFAKEYREEMGKEPSSKIYSEEEMDKIRSDIDKSKAMINKIHDYMNDLTLMKVDIGISKEIFEKLEDIYNHLVFKFPKEGEEN